ncbi:GAF and ANTAR domain-containing protein [Nocardia sp. NPDC050712]|uniref:GAF and ANTAR domain-containing protein n=1 Tax=Nocardia sp. NPDC050712 TaxID=3155518 RepID=UPI0034042FD1
MPVDGKALMTALSRFAQLLPTEYDVATALDGLVQSVTDVLGLTGAGVTMESQGRLRFMVAHNERLATIERNQEITQEGPCVQAHATGNVVAVNSLRTHVERWPRYTAVALRQRIEAVAAIPMHLSDSKIGTIELYSEPARTWSAPDLEVARVLADMATGYVINADKRHQQQQLTEQLQQALRSRIVIEQAKGIIANDRGITTDAAFEVIRRYSRDHQARLYAVAHAVVDAGLRL